jgi:hypothetical protein
MNSLKQFTLDIIGFLFYLYEIWQFHNSELIFAADGSTEIYVARFILLYISLPLLYLFRIAAFFDEDETLANFLSGLLKFENAGTYMQVKLFYYATNYLLVALVILELLSRLFL